MRGLENQSGEGDIEQLSVGPENCHPSQQVTERCKGSHGSIAEQGRVGSEAEFWKQPRCRSTDKWVEQPWCLAMEECYSGTGRKTLAPPVAAWMGPEGIRQREVSQTERDKCRLLPHICGI